MSIVNFSNPSQTGLIYDNYAAGTCWEPVTYYIKCAATWDFHKVSVEFYWQRLESSIYRVKEKSRVVELNCWMVLGEFTDHLNKE